MRRARITLKNYGPFSDEEPLRFEIGSGFTNVNPELNLSTLDSAAGFKRGNVYVINGEEIDCRDFIEIAAAFNGSRYFGPFRNAVNQGSGAYYDLQIGTSFIDLWDTWKNAGVKQNARAVEQVTNDIKRLFEFDSLEINASKQ